MQYKFPDDKVKFLIKKYQKNYKMYERGEIKESQYNRIKKDLESKLFVDFKQLQEMIINYKVLRKHGIFTGGGTRLIEGFSDIFEDLVMHQIDQMFQYIHKIDTSKKAYSILQKIQNTSSRVYFFSNYKDDQKNITQIDTAGDDEEFSANEMIDNIYMKYNPYDHEKVQLELMMEQMNVKKEKEKDTRKDWVIHFHIFEKIESIIIYGFIKNNRGILRKLHVMNVYMKNQIDRFNKDIHFFIDMVELNKKYNIRYSTKRGLEKIITVILDSYTKNDPQIRLGKKQISIYQSLLLYFLVTDGSINRNLINDDEWEDVLRIEKYFDSSKLNNNYLFDLEFTLS